MDPYFGSNNLKDNPEEQIRIQILDPILGAADPKEAPLKNLKITYQTVEEIN